MNDDEIRSILLPLMREFNTGLITDDEFCDRLDELNVSDETLERGRQLLYA
jgi:hypothetical protein